MFVRSLNGGTGRFARGKLVYWSLNRVNEERSQPEGREEEEKGKETTQIKRRDKRRQVEERTRKGKEPEREGRRECNVG